MIFAVSEAIFPMVPTNAIRYGIRAGGTSLRHPFKRDIISPDSSQRPIPSVMVITRPSGAKPVKFFTILSRNQCSPSTEKKFWETTASPDAGLIRLTPATVAIVPMIAVKRKSQQNRITGSGSLLHTFSTTVNALSSQVCFVAVLVFSLIQKPPVIVKVRNN